MSTRAVVAKRGKCIVRTTGHYIDAKYEGFFFFLKQRALNRNDLNTSKVHLRESGCKRLLVNFQQLPTHTVYSLVPYNESYTV